MLHPMIPEVLYPIRNQECFQVTTILQNNNFQELAKEFCL